jgi:hypothetical protein
MSHNLVTEIKKKLSHTTIGTQLAFHRDIMSKIQFLLLISPLMQEPSSFLCLNPMSIW